MAYSSKILHLFCLLLVEHPFLNLLHLIFFLFVIVHATIHLIVTIITDRGLINVNGVVVQQVHTLDSRIM